MKIHSKASRLMRERERERKIDVWREKGKGRESKERQGEESGEQRFIAKLPD